MSFVICDACPPGCNGIDLGDGNYTGCSCSEGKLANGMPIPSGFPCDCPNHEVRSVDKLGCDVVYNGPTFPQYHGTKCTAEYHENKDERHRAMVDGEPLRWFTDEQKAEIRKRRG